MSDGVVKKFSVDSAILLAGFTAVLYSWSTAHYHGFILTLKLNADMMERNFHQIIYGGLLVSFAPLLFLLIMALLVAFLYSHGVVPVYVDWVRKSVKNKRRVIKNRRMWIGKRNSSAIELKAKSVTARIVILFAVGSFYIFSLHLSEVEGVEKAKRMIAMHVEGKIKQSQMLKVKINNVDKTLMFLACGATNCAGIEEKTNRVYYFPTNQGYSYLYSSD